MDDDRRREKMEREDKLREKLEQSISDRLEGTLRLARLTAAQWASLLAAEGAGYDDAASGIAELARAQVAGRPIQYPDLAQAVRQARSAREIRTRPAQRRIVSGDSGEGGMSERGRERIRRIRDASLSMLRDWHTRGTRELSDEDFAAEARRRANEGIPEALSPDEADDPRAAWAFEANVASTLAVIAKTQKEIR